MTGTHEDDSPEETAYWEGRAESVEEIRTLKAEITRLQAELDQRPGWQSDFPEDYAKELAERLVQNLGEGFPADPEADDTYCISAADLINGIETALSFVDMDRLKAPIPGKEVSS